MKILYTSFNQKLGLNPMCGRLLYAIPGFEQAGVHDCEAVFLSFIAPECDFVPDKMTLDAVARRKLPVIIFDHSEVFSENMVFPFMAMPQESPYKVLERVVLDSMDVKAYFKRELLSSKTDYTSAFTFPIFPLDWTLSVIPGVTSPKVDTREEYNARPIDIFMSWGYSSESRPRLMGELLRQAGRFNAHFCLTEEDLDRALQEGHERIFALLFTPHFRRIHFSKLFDWQSKAKISISMFGAGKKCFRCAEASYNSVMAQQHPESLQWSYPWIGQENCLTLPIWEHDSHIMESMAVDYLYTMLREQQGSLYDIYLKGIENNKHYHNTVYSAEYLAPRIRKALE